MRKIAIFLVFCGVAACLPLLAAQPAYLTVWPTSGEPECYALGDMPRMEIKDGKLRVSARGAGASSYEIANVNRLTFDASVPKKVKKTAGRDDCLNALFVYGKTGASALPFSSFRRMTSFGDSLRVDLADTTYMLSIADIDSIGLHGFGTSYNKRVVKLDPYIEYVENVDSLAISFKASLPKKMELKEGDILLYEGLCSTFPKGIARVVKNVETSSSIRLSTRQATIDEVYETLFVYGEYEMKEEAEALPSLVKKKSSVSAQIGLGGGAGLNYEDGNATLQQETSLGTFGYSEDGTLSLENETEVNGAKRKFGVSIGDGKFNIKTTHATLTLSGGLTPDYNVLVIKQNKLTPASVDVKVDVDFWVEATAKAECSGNWERHTPWAMLVPDVPIPECPIVSVGLWADAFVELEGKGSLTSGIRYDGHAKFEGGYNIRRGVYADGTYQSGFSNPRFKCELEGSIWAGIGINPHVSLLEGAMAVGPVVNVGPKLKATLKVDILKAIECTYSALLDCKADLSLDASLTAETTSFVYKKSADGALDEQEKRESSESKCAYSFPIAERWFLPLFTVPRVITSNEGEKTAFVSTHVSRPLVFPVTIGYEIQQDGKELYSYEEPETYWAPENDVRMIHEFSGFRYKTPYTALPTVSFLGFKMEAVPASDFHFTPEIDTRPATGIRQIDAICHGHLGDPTDPTLVEYGIRYRISGHEDWYTDRASNLSLVDGSFSCIADGLSKETNYEFQAYAIYGEDECHGDVLSFRTLGDPSVGPYVEKYLTDNFLIIKDNGEIVAKIGNIGYMGDPGGWWYKYDYSSRCVYHYFDGKWLRPYNDVHLFEHDDEEDWREDPATNYGREHNMHDFWQKLLAICNNNEEEAQRKLFKDYYVGDEVVLGIKCWHFNTFGMFGYTSEYWIDPENGICLREVWRDGYGRVSSSALKKYDKNYHSWTSEIKPR